MSPENFRSTLFPKPTQNTTSSENNTNSGHMIFRDFLREQIDNLMTGDGRDGLAEGRRGTHVEVTFSAFEPLFSQIFTDLLQLVHNLHQAGKIHNLQQVCGVSGWVLTVLIGFRVYFLTRLFPPCTK